MTPNASRTRIHSPYEIGFGSVHTDWAIHQAVNWRHEAHTPRLFHIHGDQDRIFPIRYIRNCIPVRGGTHLMLLNKGKKLVPTSCASCRRSHMIALGARPMTMRDMLTKSSAAKSVTSLKLAQNLICTAGISCLAARSFRGRSSAINCLNQFGGPSTKDTRLDFMRWDHHAWQASIDSMTPEAIFRHLEQGVQALTRICGKPPTCSASPGWKTNETRADAERTLPLRV